MACIVQKFGGTSVATLDLIKKTARRVKTEVDAGHAVVVVVSAMAGTTDHLIESIRDLSPTYDRAEYDLIASSGEQITAGLLAVALQNLDIPARSWLGWQIPIYTTSQFSHAKIERVEINALVEDLNKGKVAVVAGFQGLSSEGRITTLGRGGSDTTAVALAAALRAERCDIFTDVDGIYTADPRYVTAADKLEHIAYHEMLELAAQGAKVLQKESVELAMKHHVPLRVLSSLSETPGTLITSGATLPQKSHIRGVAHTFNEVKITLTALPQIPSSISSIKTILETHSILADMFHTVLSICGNFLDCSFTVLASEAERTHQILEEHKKNLQFHNLLRNSDVAKISIVGVSLQINNSPAYKLFQTLKQEGLHIQAVAASEIKVSVLLAAHEAEHAIASLHTIYHLDTEKTHGTSEKTFK